MKMKRLLAASALCAMTLALAACGGKRKRLNQAELGSQKRTSMSLLLTKQGPVRILVPVFFARMQKNILERP